MINLTDDNFLSYAMNHYENSTLSSLDQFQEDLKRVSYIKKLLNRYVVQGKDIRERLILNHIIIFSNSFQAEHVRNIMYFKIDEMYHEALRPFFLYLSLEEYNHDKFKIDEFVVHKLRNI